MIKVIVGLPIVISSDHVQSPIMINCIYIYIYCIYITHPRPFPPKKGPGKRNRYGHKVFLKFWNHVQIWVWAKVQKICFTQWIDHEIASQVWLPWHHQEFQAQHLWRPWEMDRVGFLPEKKTHCYLWHFTRKTPRFSRVSRRQVLANARPGAMWQFLVETSNGMECFEQWCSMSTKFGKHIWSWHTFWHPWSFLIWNCFL